MTTILIIEDHELTRQYIAEVLGYAGYSTIEAANGRVGVQLAKTHAPDLILCDVVMPEMNGYEVFRQLQKEPTVIPFLFLTAQAEQRPSDHGLQIPEEDYITKPFVPHELVEIVKTRLK